MTSLVDIIDCVVYPMYVCITDWQQTCSPRRVVRNITENVVTNDAHDDIQQSCFLLRRIFSRICFDSDVSLKTIQYILSKRKLMKRVNTALTALLYCYNTTGSKIPICYTQLEWETSLQNKNEKWLKPSSYIRFVVVVVLCAHVLMTDPWDALVQKQDP